MNTCKCESWGVSIEELLQCKTHLKGHTILGCQICMTAVCKLFFVQEEQSK